MLLTPFFFLLLAIFPLSTTTASAATFNVAAMGAKPDGRSDAAKAFRAAWAAACASRSAATIYVPPGRYRFGTAVTFGGGRCRSRAIHFKILGTLVAPPPAGHSGRGNAPPWLSFDGVTGVSISGGTIDGQGAAVWACRRAGHARCPEGFTNLEFTKSRNIVISGLRSLNCQRYHIAVSFCKDVKLHGVTVTAPGDSPNTDGIHVQYSAGVMIFGSRIATGDDCVSVGPGTNGLWIEKVSCGPGHGISIGSLGKDVKEAGVQNVTVTSSKFIGTGNGVRIKSWGKPSDGFVNKVLFQHLTMVNVQNPIIIDQNYCPYRKGCPGKVSGVRIGEVSYKDIRGSSATRVAVKFDCSSRHPCRGLRMENVRLSYKSGKVKRALASCNHAGGVAHGFVEPKSCF